MFAYTIHTHKYTYMCVSFLYKYTICVFPTYSLDLFIDPIYMYHVQIIIVTFIECLLCSRYNARCFTWIISFSL